MLTMIPVHRGTATSPHAFFRVKPSKIPATLNELRVTGAVCALSAGGKEACFETASFFYNAARETENATYRIKGSHCHGDQ